MLQKDIDHFLNNEPEFIKDEKVILFGSKSSQSDTDDDPLVAFKTTSYLAATCRDLRSELSSVLFSRVSLATKDVYAAYIFVAKLRHSKLIASLTINDPNATPYTNAARESLQGKLVRFLPNLTHLSLAGFRQKADKITGDMTWEAKDIRRMIWVLKKAEGLKRVFVEEGDGKWGLKLVWTNDTGAGRKKGAQEVDVEAEWERVEQEELDASMDNKEARPERALRQAEQAESSMSRGSKEGRGKKALKKATVECFRWLAVSFILATSWPRIRHRCEEWLTCD